MKVCIVGSGYVGLVTGVCFADMGNDVMCVDIDEKKIERLSRGEAIIYEPGLQEMMERNMAEKRLMFSTDLARGVAASQMVFIAVGTPEGEDGSADLKYVLAVASEIGKHLEDYRVVAVKSTVPVGTCEKVKAAIAKELEARGADIAFDVVSNPEFLKEGGAIQDFLKPDRIVIGCETKRAEELLSELYAPFLRTNHPVIPMDVRSAEMTKYASNAMLATKISFINEIANICEEVNADVGSVRLGMGADQRIGYQFLFPGLGYGGSCFPKDVKALIHTARSKGYEPLVLAAVDGLNDRQKSTQARKALNYFKDKGLAPKDACVAVWGLSFKPNTDDVREAPALYVIEMLLAAGCKVSVFDPVAQHSARRAIGEPEGLTYCNDNYEALTDADALIICTEWGVFRRPDYERMKSLMKSPVVFDGRNIFEPDRMKARGFAYFGVGRKA